MVAIKKPKKSKNVWQPVVPHIAQKAHDATKDVTLPPGMRPEMRYYNSIHRSPSNPRKNAHAVPAVRASLKQFGWRQPVVIDINDEIVVGDTRYQAAVSLIEDDPMWGWIPCVSAADLTPAQIIAYRAADNRTGEIAEWDTDKLMADLAMIADQPFDLAGMGFNAEELGQLEKVASPKEYTKHLQDFDTMPTPKPRWIMIACAEDVAVEVLSKIKELPQAKECNIQYS
jgi:hypothetical protein